LKPGEQGAKRWHSVTARGSESEPVYGYERNPCQKRPHLGHTVKRRRWCETSGKLAFDAANEKVCALGPNRSDYRGISHRLMSGILGLYLTGVKREPKDRCIKYHYVNVGSIITGLIKTEPAAVEVVIMWQSQHSSLSQIRSGTWRRKAVIAKG
jgi:hypothetical protein